MMNLDPSQRAAVKDAVQRDYAVRSLRAALESEARTSEAWEGPA